MLDLCRYFLLATSIFLATASMFEDGSKIHGIAAIEGVVFCCTTTGVLVFYEAKRDGYKVLAVCLGAFYIILIAVLVSVLYFTVGTNKALDACQILTVILNYPVCSLCIDFKANEKYESLQ